MSFNTPPRLKLWFKNRMRQASLFREEKSPILEAMLRLQIPVFHLTSEPSATNRYVSRAIWNKSRSNLPQIQLNVFNVFEKTHPFSQFVNAVDQLARQQDQFMVVEVCGGSFCQPDSKLLTIQDQSHESRTRAGVQQEWVTVTLNICLLLFGLGCTSFSLCPTSFSSLLSPFWRLRSPLSAKLDWSF